MASETANPDNLDKLSSLEAQNKDLSSQLEDTRKELQMLRESMFNSSLQTAKKMKPSKTEVAKAPKAEKVKHSKESKGSASQNAGSQSSTEGNEVSAPPTGFAPSGGPSAFNSTTVAPNVASSALSSIPNVSSLPQFSSEASPIVNLELAGVNVKPNGVRINVILRNGMGQALEIPPSTKAVVRMIGMPDQLADVKFPVKSLDAGMAARGYISVSGHKLDPSADVFIPKLVSTANGTRDVHLTVPISALSSERPH
jgi:hypothetical protein